jgi:hypothetical protein
MGPRAEGIALQQKTGKVMDPYNPGHRIVDRIAPSRKRLRQLKQELAQLTTERPV